MSGCTAPRRGGQEWTRILAVLISVHGAGSDPVSSPTDENTSQCSVSCDDQGRCMPLRFLWGAQKGGTTGLWDMLDLHLACGANRRFPSPDVLRNEKESHYLASLKKTPNRFDYIRTYLLAECASHCFIDATPDNLMVPFTAARLHSMMTSAEAVRRPRMHCSRKRALPPPHRHRASTPRCTRAPAQARARFVVQLREPVSRQVSFLQMESRIGKSYLSVEHASVIYLREWMGHTHGSSALKAVKAEMPAVRACNAADASTRKSAECARVATIAATFTVQLVLKCIILPFGHGDQAVGEVVGRDPVTIGNCYPSNYPPVRDHTRPSGTCPPPSCRASARINPSTRSVTRFLAAGKPLRPLSVIAMHERHILPQATSADRSCMPPRLTLSAVSRVGRVRGSAALAPDALLAVADPSPQHAHRPHFPQPKRIPTGDSRPPTDPDHRPPVWSRSF
eukprot:scaffold3013_cov113-Isochrysis_galbana.AAC.11